VTLFFFGADLSPSVRTKSPTLLSR